MTTNGSTTPVDLVAQPDQPPVLPTPPPLPPILPPIFPPLPGQPQPPQHPPRDSSFVNLVRPFGLSPAFEAVVGMAEAWLRLAVDEMMYRGEGRRVVPDVEKLLSRSGLSGAGNRSELATGYQNHITEMNRYTMYLRMRDADVHRRLVRMTASVDETLRSVWGDIDQLNGVLDALRIPLLVPWLESMLVARIVTTLTDVQRKMNKLLEANRTTASGIDPGIDDVTPPFVEMIDPGVVASRPREDSVLPA